jgi:predicted AAA+ superfamily ATPase
LLPGIKMRVDTGRKAGAFWLTGSQQFQLMKGVSESLAGRVAILNLLGFSVRERTKRDDLAKPFLPTRLALGERAGSAGQTAVTAIFRTLWRGSLPALVVGRPKDRNLFYSSYLQTYLQRDVRDIAQVGDQAAFVRFLRACAARTAQLLNYSDLARDVDVSVKTAQHWLSILVASFQVALLQPYHTNVTKRLVKTPKLYFLDTGLAAYLTEWASPETLAAGAMAGAMFETFVFLEILKGWWNRMRAPALYYYRDKDGKEIDLLFVQDRTLHPVEVKLGATPRKDWIRHFSALGTLRIPIGEGGVVCLCKELLPLDGANSAIPAGLL